MFRSDTLEGIAAGRVRLAFRRWARARVRPGSRLRTPVGVVEVLDVAPVEEISDDELALTGLERGELEALLEGRPGALYRIELHLAGPDPRVGLRQQARLTSAEIADLQTRLARLDRAAPRPWTWQTLSLIAEHPAVVSTELAARLDEERATFKRRVRRLKELGLTESLEVGYRLSPRGQALLRASGKRQ